MTASPNRPTRENPEKNPGLISGGSPALHHSAHHVIITTDVGTPLCWRLTRCHRVLPSQVSYGLIGWVGVYKVADQFWVGVCIKYSKPFVCICKHTATRIRILRGCTAEVGYLTVSVSWPSALRCNPCPTHCSPGNVPTPTQAPLMDTPSVKTGQQIYMMIKYRALSHFGIAMRQPI